MQEGISSRKKLVIIDSKGLKGDKLLHYSSLPSAIMRYICNINKSKCFFIQREQFLHSGIMYSLLSSEM